MPTSEFYGVTRSGSVYRVYVEADGSRAVIEKIAEASGQQGGLAIGTKLEGAYYAGITNSGLVQYMASIRDDKPVPAMYITNNRWGGQTTPLVALFLDEAKARKCAEVPNLQPWDERWTSETKETLDAIRAWNNPRIVLDPDVPIVR